MAFQFQFLCLCFILIVRDATSFYSRTFSQSYSALPSSPFHEKLWSLPKSEEVTEPTNRGDQERINYTTFTTGFTCQSCKTWFPSRNGLFRHLRADGCTPEQPIPPRFKSGGNDDTKQDPIVKQSIMFAFSYVDNGEGTMNDASPVNVWAGEQIVKLVQESISKYNKNCDDQDDLLVVDWQTNRRTQASVAGLRSKVLQQEKDCAASHDIIVLTGSCRKSSLQRLQQVLQSQVPYNSDITSNIDSPQRICRLVACKWLDSEIVPSLHAERSCTQLVYHYLVPLSWLPDGDLLIRHWKGWEGRPPTESIQKFKAALRQMQSPMVSASFWDEYDNRDGTHDGINLQLKVATNRFGRLGAKVRRAWHNFADPSLRGNISPNHESTWRCIDSCKIMGMVGHEDPSTETCLVVEIKGDAFLPTQIRRLIGTALAVTHGWLPSNAVSDQDEDKAEAYGTLFSPYHVTETILAPGGRLYLADCRFHFEESRTSGRSLFSSASDACGKVFGDVGSNKHSWTQRQLLLERSSNELLAQDQSWLETCEMTAAPRIAESLQLQTDLPQSGTPQIDDLKPPPLAYESVLDQLRDIMDKEKWPSTSVARSTVIRSTTSSEPITEKKGGSFTIINPSLLHDMQSNSKDEVPIPLGNQLFPELVEAIFSLEGDISKDAALVEDDSTGTLRVLQQDPRRVPRQSSTHCAVNSQAQFTPHVDSGRGLGQSRSLIVGLGDYRNGELQVEGLPCDIRYAPLEFDGWSLRHWTNAYIGERFSLVWFTPELK